MRVSLPTLGCKANQADTAALRDAIAHEVAGVRFVGAREAADVVLVNTCTVTHTADADARQVIRRAHRKNPQAQIVVTGCYAQTDRQALLAMPEVSHVVGNVHKAGLGALVGRLARGEDPEVPLARPGHRDWNPTLRDALAIERLPLGQTRPLLKVQDGCNYVCSFCIIPTARGRSRSVDFEALVAEVQRYEALGAQEIVLTGIHLGHWGRDLSPKRRFGQMVAALLERTRVPRLRISSLEPNEVDSEVLDLVAEHPRVCAHLHVPLQSGHDGTLARMRRVYRTDWYRKAFGQFRERVPRGAWGADVMVGFPGEDDAAFQATVDLLQDLDVTYLHVFPYSPRRGTEAAGLPDQVSPEIKRQRTGVLVALSDQQRARHARRAVGEEVEVLVERARVGGRLRGYSGHYVPVSFDGPDAWRGGLRRVRITGADGAIATGEAL